MTSQECINQFEKISKEKRDKYRSILIDIGKLIDPISDLHNMEDYERASFESLLMTLHQCFLDDIYPYLNYIISKTDNCIIVQNNHKEFLKKLVQKGLIEPSLFGE